MKQSLEKYKVYANAVQEGKIVACEYVKLATKRYLDWFNREDLEFKSEKVDRVVNFISKLKHFQGKHNGKPFILLDYQFWIISNIFGWYYKGTEKRVINYVYIELARKQGKTALAAAICLYMLIADGENGSEATMTTSSLYARNGDNNVYIDANYDESTAGITVSGFADKLKSIYNEVALWFESIESRIGNSVDSMMQSLDMLIRAGQVIVNSDGTLGYIGYNGFTKSGSSEGYVDRTNPKDKNAGGNGDTFNFYSPKAIDEIEAAKQMKKTKQDMAEGF